MMIGLLLLLACTGGAREQVDSSTLHGKLMCGYQGWFNTPGDGQGMGWRHYRHPKEGFKPGAAGIEFWPDLSGFGEQERFDTPFRHADGRVAQVFSPAVPETVARHFLWMKEYGIDGVFLQRFATEVTLGDGRADTPKSRAINRVLDHVRAGAARHGRTYAVMYDLSGMTTGRIAGIKDDWRGLVKGKGILKDPSYQRHSGKPVVAIWGIGLNDGRSYGPREVGDLIDFLKSDPECGGLTVMLGTAACWRTGERDAEPFVKWEAVYRRADILSPWMVGRYRDIPAARHYATTRAREDRIWCETNGKDFMPVVFPGFAWSNLKKGSDMNPGAFIDRQDGRFQWAQYDAHIREGGVKMIYQAMFDELDEGTQIFKVTDDPPVGESRFLSYGGLPGDHYLWLAGEAARRLRRELPSTPEIPARPQTRNPPR